MAGINFSFKGVETKIAIRTKENMGNLLNDIEKGNKNDNNKKKINIIANMKEKEKDNIIISNDIICPKCKENILMNINGFEIDLFGCKQNHKFNNLSLYKFEEKQKIDIKKIICEVCNKNNKYSANKSQFFFCFTCNKNLCFKCKESHDKNHLIVEDKLKNHICKKHNKKFIKYCETCKEDICAVCVNKHSDHKHINLGDILPNKDELLNNAKKLKNVIDIFKYRAKFLTDIINNMVNIMDMYYKISKNLFNNFETNNKNYNSIQNLIHIKEKNELLIKDLNNLFKDAKLIKIYEYSFNNFYDINGERYAGGMKKNLKEGKGIFYYDKKSNERYEGDWINNKREGKGTMNWNNGDKYEGDWKNDKKEGKGIMHYSNGEKYDGEWKNDKYDGKGIKTFKNGDVYNGEYKNSMKNGKGTLQYKNGDKYEGNWENGKIEGYGNMLYINGDVYEGNWKNGVKDGKGSMIYKNGEKYDGDWKDNKRIGNCTMIYIIGETYEGNWLIDKREGKGKYTFKDGSEYDGDWENDTMTGKGVMNWSNGDKYDGDWKNNKRDGKGIMIYHATNEKYDGEWKDDKRNGEGKLLYPNDKIKQKGTWINDVYHKKKFSDLFNKLL